jgi:hypothetical protein
MKLTVIDGGRSDPKLLRVESRLKRLIRRGATFRIDGGVLARISSGIRLTQLKTMLKKRCRVIGVEPGVGAGLEILLVKGVITEELENGGFEVKELRLKVVIEVPTEPGRVAVVDIGQLTEL